MTFSAKKFYSMLMAGTFSMVVMVFLLMSDSIVAGIFIGEKAVAAINLITPIYSFTAFVGDAFSLGLPQLYNKAMGEFDADSADSYFGNGFTISILLGIVMFILLQLFSDADIAFYSPSEEIAQLIKPYFFWYRLVILIQPYSTLIIQMVFADGDELINGVANAVQMISNIILSIILGYFWGMAGIGIGTFIGTMLSIIIASMHFFRKGNSLHIKWTLSFRVLVEIVKYSLIDAGSYFFLAVYTAVMNRFVMAVFGERMLILVSVCVFVKEMQYVFDGIGEAFSPIISVYMGEENYEGVRRSYALSKKVSIIEGIIVTVLTMPAAILIVRVFGITDPEVAAYATNGFRIAALGLTAISLLYLITSYYLLRDKIMLGLGISALRDVVFSIILAVIGGLVFGIYGIFIGLAIAPFVAYAVSIAYVSLRYGKKNCPLILAEFEEKLVEAFYEIGINAEEIIGMQKEIEKFLEDNHLPAKAIARVKLLIEELYMLVYEKNNKESKDGKSGILGECLIKLKDDGVQIITKDDGVLFDISDDDIIANSVTSFAVSGYMDRMKDDKNHLTTMSYNRNCFLVKYS